MLICELEHLAQVQGDLPRREILLSRIGQNNGFTVASEVVFVTEAPGIIDGQRTDSANTILWDITELCERRGS